MINAIILEPNKKAKVVKIDESLASLQAIVEGNIEACYPSDDPIVMIVNEEGKLDNLPYNRGLKNPDGTIYDFIAGTAIIASVIDENGADDGNFHSLSDKMLKKYKRQFLYPEFLVGIKNTDTYYSIPIE